MKAGVYCPECGKVAWNDLGCTNCGLEFSPPSEAYWDASRTTISERVAQVWADREPEPGSEDWYWEKHQFVAGDLCRKLDHDDNCWDFGNHGLVSSYARDCGFGSADWRDPEYRAWLLRELGPPPVPVLPRNASPIERKFWDAHLRLSLPALNGLVPQHTVGRYRIDFAIPARKIGIELDGFRNHSSTADIAKDRKRQRFLESQGWYITRFGGSEVHLNAEQCVREAARLAHMRGSTS